jgi:hypothetical protein
MMYLPFESLSVARTGQRKTQWANYSTFAPQLTQVRIHNQGGSDPVEFSSGQNSTLNFAGALN